MNGLWHISRTLLLAATLAAALPSRAAVWINEFVADNDGSFLTAAGQNSDWIELHNPSADTIDLGGWHLTDNVPDPDDAFTLAVRCAGRLLRRPQRHRRRLRIPHPAPPPLALRRALPLLLQDPHPRRHRQRAPRLQDRPLHPRHRD